MFATPVQISAEECVWIVYRKGIGEGRGERERELNLNEIRTFLRPCNRTFTLKRLNVPSVRYLKSYRVVIKVNIE